MYGTAIVLALNHQRVRFYCCICALIWRCYWHSMQYGVIISPSSCVPQIHYNARWWFCVDLHLSNGWRIGPEQTNRPYVCIAACACAWAWTCQWFPMQYEVVISLNHVISKYTTMAITTLRWSLCVKCMERVSCWRLALNDQRVRLYWYVHIRNCFLGMLELNGVIDDWCGMRS